MSSEMPDHDPLAAALMYYKRGESPPRDLEKRAVKASLAVLAQRAPGRSVEVRVPPYAAVQVIAGATHRRGTPPAVVECDARTWLELVAGLAQWHIVVADGRLRASGERSDISSYLPLEPPLDQGNGSIG
ncbi:MAG: sterol carrier family protein [Actinomycetes bacterium]